MGLAREWLRWVLLAGLALGWCDGGGQTLAHKNWEGSGLRVEAWWSRAVFCVSGSDLKRVVGEMDRLERMGCDAVEVNPGGGYGAVEEMDRVTEAAGRSKMRVVVDLDGGEDDVRAQMGFWGTRGAAGFAVTGDVSARMRQAAGARVVIADGTGGQLRVRRIPEGDAAGLQGWLAGAVKVGMMLEDGAARLGNGRAALLLASGVAARVGVDAVLPVAGEAAGAREFSAEDLALWVPQKADTDGMVEWVRVLSEIHHRNASSRTGQAVLLDFDAPGVVGWVVPAGDGRSGVVLVCNVGGKAVRVGLAGALRDAGVRGTGLKTLVRSDGVVGGGEMLEGVGLGVDGVFVGEVR